LIATFISRQSDACTHLSLPDIAKHWAPLRRETTLKAAKEAALDDLMEAAFEGYISELLFLDERAGVEHVIDAPWCQDADCPLHGTDRDKELSALLDAKWFADWRRFGDLESKDRYLKSQYSPHCWARREAVIAFLHKRGVDSADMPSAWLEGSHGDSHNAPAIPDVKSDIIAISRRGDVPDYDWGEAKLYAFKLLDDNGDMQEPENQVNGWRSQADLTKKVMEHLEMRDGKEPAYSTAKAYISKFITEWRRGRESSAS
jgi:hypothetical protein